jgi:putative molybdopterin biosynthesis protein
VRFTQDDVDAYIARSRHEHSTRAVKNVDASSSLFAVKDDAPSFIISGQDVVLDLLANHLQQNGTNTQRAYLSGFEGLLSLYEGKVNAAACHLYDGEGFNASYVKSLMPGIPAVLINLSYRRLGFYVKVGNPQKIKGWDDLKREDISILNRRPGSGARIVLDIQLKKMGLDAKNIRGYDTIMKSHLTMAAAVAEGEADLALGTERVSKQMDGIEFIPLLEESLDLVLRRDSLSSPAVQMLLKLMDSKEFRREAGRFSGNDYRDMGKITEV